MVKKNIIQSTGRRKSSVARIRMVEGNGSITVNGLSAEDYFGTALQIEMLKLPFQEIGASKKYDIVASVKGGGKSGQCGALVHAASRALASIDEDSKASLKKAGFLSRDARVKERKKPGQPGARKRFQFSKR